MEHQPLHTFQEISNVPTYRLFSKNLWIFLIIIFYPSLMMALIGAYFIYQN
jgi:nitrate reductase NapE component